MAHFLLEQDTVHVVYIGALSRKVWHLAGPNMGAEGAKLGVSPTGLIFGPVSQLWSEGARQDGATWLRSVRDKREFDFTAQLEGSTVREFRAIHDSWWREWSTDKTGWIGVYTKYAGWRWLRVRLGEAPTPVGKKDSSFAMACDYDMLAIADDPLWTTFEESTHWINDIGFNEGLLRIRNAADQKVYPKYTISGPGRFYIQDPGDTEFLRLVQTPLLLVDETLRIDTHPRNPTARLYSPSTGENGRNVWAQLKGRRWLFPIEPYTSTDVIVRVELGSTASQVYSTAGPRFARPY